MVHNILHLDLHEEYKYRMLLLHEDSPYRYFLLHDFKTNFTSFFSNKNLFYLTAIVGSTNDSP